jgi:hypothetical protein
MLHFLPEQNKKQITIEYLLRVSVYLFRFILCAIVLLIVLFLPSLIFSTYKNTTVKNQLASIHTVNTAGGEDPVTVIKNANALGQVFLVTLAPAPFVSDTIKKIISLKDSDIQISNITVSEDTGSETYVIVGISKTRDGLTTFDNNLITDGTFSHIDLPVADLIADTNNNFTITLTYTYKTSQ